MYTDTAPWVPFLAYQKGDVAKNIENLSASVVKGNAMVEKAKNDIQKKGEQIDNIIEKAREASAAAGAAVFTKDFDKEAKQQSENAKNWLIAAACLGVFTVGIASLTWFWTYAGLDTGQLWQKIVSKVVVLSILGTATLWCGKIYKALMHQSATNRHRALSLQTFQAFVVATADPQIKDAVLLEATRSIFAIGITGYVDSGSGSTDSEARVIEIVKSCLPKK